MYYINQSIAYFCHNTAIKYSHHQLLINCLAIKLPDVNKDQ